MNVRLGRLLTPHGSRALDAVVVGGLFVTDLVGVAVDRTNGRVVGGGRAAGLVVGAGLCAAAFGWRRHRPLLVAAAVAFGYPVAAAVNQPVLVTQRTGAQIVLAVYAVAAWAGRRRRLGAALAAAVAVLAAAGAAGDGAGAVQVVAVPVALVGAPWFAGAASRLRRRHLAGVEERLASADADREARAKAAVADERARIARELHDVVAHHVSLIGVQAGAARTTLDAQGGDGGARDALAGIEASSRDAVREMRRLLEVLDAGDRAPLPPPVRGADLLALAAGFRAAGLTVRVTCDDGVDALGAAAVLTVYRIVEEALTNVTRHSQARACDVRIEVRGCSARVVVADPGPSHPRAPVPPPGAGRGLVGMRERVALFHGTLGAGPAPSGGFVVDVMLPGPS